MAQEYKQEELAGDSEEKRIKKAQEKAVRKKKQLITLSKKPHFDSARGINTTATRSFDDRQLFRGNACVCPFFVISKVCSTWNKLPNFY